jgi:tetratricopeptide (TPR) repeat protein
MPSATNASAAARLKAALAGLPPAASTAVIAAERALSAHKPDEAERHLIGAMALAPAHAEVLHMLGNVQAMRGQHGEALATLQRATAARPDDPSILNSLGIALGKAGRPDDAIAALHQACRLDPQLVGAWFNLALVHAGLAEYDQAIAALRSVVALAPAHHNARSMLADILREDGHIDEARAQYRDVLARQPLSGMAWWGLANIKTVPLQAADADAIRRALANPQTGAHDRIAMLFALGKALEDQQRYPEAFAALQEANDRARQRKPPWSAAAMSAQVDALLRTFPARAVTGSDFGSEAIFVVSLPRSGSTLAEQILASHPQVEGASELGDLWQVLAEESQRRRRPLVEWASGLAAVDWRRLGERYLERTARWRVRRPRFTNKMPNNWLYAGAALAMLPGARIVACRRDPLETCFACYRQMLNGNEYTHNFNDLAAYWRDFDRAVRHWQATDQRIRVQVYEDLVADPEAQTRELLDFCGLPFDPACLRFYETERRVRTPSSSQVREPIRANTARTARYGSLLDPLRQALMRAGAAVDDPSAAVQRPPAQ